MKKDLNFKTLQVNGLRIFEPKDIEAVTALLNDYLR